MAPRAGPPRLDPVQRLLHRFYEPLILLHLLEPSRGTGEFDSAVEREERDFTGLWRTFLDGLSWICDCEKGGGTVSAVCAEDVPSGTKFWLASRNGKAVAHLRIMLAKLESLSDASPSEIEETRQFIVDGSVEFSRNKVINYSKLLCKAMMKATENSTEETSPQLLEELQALVQVRKDHKELCSRASNFRNIQSLNALAKNAPSGERSSWVQLKHLIGRLSSWSRSARHCIFVAMEYPQYLTGFSLSYLPFPIPTSLPAADQKTNLESALKRMLPARNDARIAELMESLTGIRDFDFSEKFKETYHSKNSQPEIHAEVLLWEHFYFNGLEFIGNDKYIGCSKSSCYCCHLYMRSHPGHPVTRRSHGNLWPKWSPPLSLESGSDTQDKHVKDILNEMCKYVRKDLIDQIDSRNPHKKYRGPESSTGIAYT